MVKHFELLRGLLVLALLAGHSAPVMADEAGTAAKVDALFAEYAKPGAPGVAVGVYRGGSVVYAKGYGLADLESGASITPQTQFHIASVSKQFAAYAIALLAREGKIDLDADVHRYLPYFPDFGHKITTRQLILHTSGLRDQWTLFEIGGRDMRDLLRQQQVVNMVRRQRALNFVPGTNSLYSNTGYTLLAEIVQSVTGKTLRQFTTERMFGPLGMNHTFFFDDVREVVPGRANSYEQQKDGTWKRSLLNYDTVGATSLFTSIEDFAHWAGNFGNPKVGDAALIQQVSRSGTLNDGTPIHYGFGLADLPEGGRTAISHSGSDADFRTQFIYYPEADFAVAVFANRDAPVSVLAKAVADIYLPAVQAEAKQEPRMLAKPASALVGKLVGTYVHPANKAITLERRNGQLFALYGSGTEGSAVKFRADGSLELNRYERVRPVFSKQGDVAALEGIPRIDIPGDRYDRVVRSGGTPRTLASYAGDYRSEELDVTYTFSVEDGGLVARSVWRVDPIKMTQITADHFDAEGYAPHAVTFERNAGGDISTVRMHGDRAYNIEFRKVVAADARSARPE